eukprot:scaffold46432_cov65-Phaeocystis_antarctica.AAC.3
MPVLAVCALGYKFNPAVTSLINLIVSAAFKLGAEPLNSTRQRLRALFIKFMNAVSKSLPSRSGSVRLHGASEPGGCGTTLLLVNAGEWKSIPVPAYATAVHVARILCIAQYSLTRLFESYNEQASREKLWCATRNGRDRKIVGAGIAIGAVSPPGRHTSVNAVWRPGTRGASWGHRHIPRIGGGILGTPYPRIRAGILRTRYPEDTA